MDAHFDKLARTHLETRFIKVDAEKSPFLVERLQIVVMPTIVLVKDGKTEHSIMGFDEFGGTDNFSTDDAAFVLSKYGVLNFEVDRTEEIQSSSIRAGVNAVRLAKIQSGAYDDMSDGDDDYEI